MPYTPNNPLVPGDPYSYDLNWIVDKLKEAISLYQPLNDKFNSLYDYVHDYFEGADFEALVDDALRVMAADGTIAAAIAPLLDDYKEDMLQTLERFEEDIDARINDQNGQILLLEARMDTFASLPPGSTAGNAELLDIRVAVNGNTYPSAGDAVRAQITDNYQRIISPQNIVPINISKMITWESGSIDGGTGTDIANATRLRSIEFTFVEDLVRIVADVASGYKYAIYKYASDQSYIGVDYWFGGHHEWIIPSGTAYVRFVFANTADTNISPGEESNIVITALSNFNMAASETLAKLSNMEAPILRDGSIGNPSNANAITSEFIMPVPDNYKYAIIEWLGYEYGQGWDVGFGYTAFSGATDGMTTSAAFADAGITKTNNNTGMTDLSVTPPYIVLDLDILRGYGDHYSVFIFRKSSGSFIPLRISSEQYSLKITYAHEDIYPEYIHDIISLNPDVKNKMLEAARPINLSMDAYLSEAQPVMLLHFSDIHQSTTALRRLVEFFTAYSSYLDDAICTGDMVGERYNDGMTWWDSVPGSENILQVIGNHDALNDPVGFDWSDLVSEADAYHQYIEPYVSNWGVTYTVGNTYYYKDYAAKNVRLIVLDCMLKGTDKSAQLTWLASTLDGARLAGYSVVIAVHFRPYNSSRISCNFSNFDMGANYETLDNDYAAEVQTFINNGGEFICYIAGHMHTDMFIINDSYPTQYCICIDAANPYQSNSYGDMQRTIGERSQDLANIVVLDTASKAVKIIRIGSNIDHYVRPRNCLAFKYLTGEIITES